MKKTKSMNHANDNRPSMTDRCCARRRIKHVDAMDFSLRLTTASADLNDETAWEEEYCARAERHYHMLTEEELRRQAPGGMRLHLVHIQLTMNLRSMSQ